MLRKFLILSMALTLVWTTVGCGDASFGDPSANQARTQQSDKPIEQTHVSDGTYPVQQATYDDADGYSVALLNTAPGESSIFRAANLPMARLTDEETSSGQKSYLKVEKGQPSLHLTEDFKIEYVHNVTENQTNPQTGQQETVVVRQEPSFWTPFAGALAGQALGSLLFRPQYYVPPIYQPGIPLAGFGGYGSTYNQAVDRYRTRYNAPPAEVRNRVAFRSTGQLRSPSYGQSGYRRPSYNSDRSTGSGYGSSDLRRNNRYSRPTYRSPSGFGSSRSRSFGGRRR